MGGGANEVMPTNEQEDRAIPPGRSFSRSGGPPNSHRRVITQTWSPYKARGQNTQSISKLHSIDVTTISATRPGGVSYMHLQHVTARGREVLLNSLEHRAREHRSETEERSDMAVVNCIHKCRAPARPWHIRRLVVDNHNHQLRG